jgi:hypothetical protein
MYVNRYDGVTIDTITGIHDGCLAEKPRPTFVVKTWPQKKDTSTKNQKMKSTSENQAVYTTYTTHAVCVLGEDEVECGMLRCCNDT